MQQIKGRNENCRVAMAAAFVSLEEERGHQAHTGAKQLLNLYAEGLRREKKK